MDISLGATADRFSVGRLQRLRQLTYSDRVSVLVVQTLQINVSLAGCGNAGHPYRGKFADRWTGIARERM